MSSSRHKAKVKKLREENGPTRKQRREERRQLNAEHRQRFYAPPEKKVKL